LSVQDTKHAAQVRFGGRRARKCFREADLDKRAFTARSFYDWGRRSPCVEERVHFGSDGFDALATARVETHNLTALCGCVENSALDNRNVEHLFET
jgi:hypothetical protein